MGMEGFNAVPSPVETDVEKIARLKGELDEARATFDGAREGEIQTALDSMESKDQNPAVVESPESSVGEIEASEDGEKKEEAVGEKDGAQEGQTDKPELSEEDKQFVDQIDKRLPRSLERAEEMVQRVTQALAELEPMVEGFKRMPTGFKDTAQDFYPEQRAEQKEARRAAARALRERYRELFSQVNINGNNHGAPDGFLRTLAERFRDLLKDDSPAVRDYFSGKPDLVSRMESVVEQDRSFWGGGPMVKINEEVGKAMRETYQDVNGAYDLKAREEEWKEK
jgi:hypothetical protein